MANVTTQYDEPSRPAQLTQADSNYSQPSQYSAAQPSQTVPHTDAPLPHGNTAYQNHGNSAQQGQQSYGLEQPGTKPLSQQDFLQRIDGTKTRISQLTQDIGAISSIHQRMLSSPDNRSSAELESIVSQTQIRNTQIKDEIKFLERDAARDSSNSFKRTQVESLKRTFKSQLEDFQREEADYSKRYREAIARQYRVINPEATDAEVQEAANADWGDEGIFTQAVSTLSIIIYASDTDCSCSSRATAAAKRPASSVLCVLVTTIFSALRRPWSSWQPCSSSSMSKSFTRRRRLYRLRTKPSRSRKMPSTRTRSWIRVSNQPDVQGSSSGGLCSWWYLSLPLLRWLLDFSSVFETGNRRASLPRPS